MGVYNGLDDVERRGFVTWGDSWRGVEWEVTEGFVRKWGDLLLEGCEEVVEVANRWREVRGEGGLVVEEL